MRHLIFLTFLICCCIGILYLIKDVILFAFLGLILGLITLKLRPIHNPKRKYYNNKNKTIYWK